ncbi:[FeFe] hydrogenase H-cluster radical SAM maturase HydE [Paludibacter sp.]|uniref:[FeFe] hydrogenase H-cluster radical SAM maturase HydE n=1 Tax=Paludibacter sp. TaxID=1898105 RepID=UPI00135499C8|nr:[FeFe] hydrogenase H-cluster radical SAM maturase HydE [Paludibacter sp.]MTK53726.1 [FeFe] hydrogenase H-cluster radical SAM maturase HydE [Paludibacter sp.]
MNRVSDILSRKELLRDDIIFLLQLSGEDEKILFRHAAQVKQETVGNKVFLRGLVEMSNVCRKDCLYCGIRTSNSDVNRYSLSEYEVLSAIRFAHENRYGSVALQSGELTGKSFTDKISRIIARSEELTGGSIGITLSCGEQSEEVYREWFDKGAHRYLLRIESSSRELYERIHPRDANHRFDARVNALYALRKIGYQVGTGVMVGLPFQNVEHLADDLLFMKRFDIDMCGMGPYIEHKDTPLYSYREGLMTLNERLQLTLRMIAILRILMPDINIAATTALQAIDKMGREKAIQIGANILMPNITPGRFRDSYALYENKPCTDENADDCKSCIDVRVHLVNHEVGYAHWGDSPRFAKRDVPKGK